MNTLFGNLPTVRQPDFAELWACWPKGRKVGEEAARRAYRNALKSGVKHEFLVERALVYSASVQHVERRYVLHLSSWLNGKRYDDELEPENGTGTATPRTRGEERFDDLRGFVEFSRRGS